MIFIKQAKYINCHIIECLFSDNQKYFIDLKDYQNRNGLFAELRDIEYFKKFRLDEELGTIVWENGLDISPQRLYELATGIKPNWAV